MASERVLKYTMLPRLKIILWSPYLYINCRALRTYVRFWWCLALSVRHMPFTCSCPKMPAWIHALLLSFRPEPRCGVEPFAQITSPLWTKSVEVRYIIIVLFVSPIFSVRRYVSSGRPMDCMQITWPAVMLRVLSVNYPPMNHRWTFLSMFALVDCFKMLCMTGTCKCVVQ